MDNNQKNISGTEVGVTSKLFVRRCIVITLCFLLIFGFLIYRIAKIQFADGEEYRNAAQDQYTHELTIPARRGDIIDRNGTVLATTITVQNCFISPADIPLKDESGNPTDEKKELVIKELSRILGVEESFVREKADKTNRKYEMIKKELSAEEEAAVRLLIAEEGLTNIVHLEESTKRYYPYSNLGCHILGFTGRSNNGLQGLEYTYDEYLTGIDGRVVKATDANGNEINFDYESYIDAIDGYSVVTTVDWSIQSILEKYLKQAYEETKPTGTVTGIICDVNTGDVLALSNYPSFDLNNYSTLTEPYLLLLDEFLATEGVTEEEIANYKAELRYKMWSNFAVSSTYEPGSTFKMVTGAIALDEGCITETDTFECQGRYVIAGVPIKCHVYGKSVHGTQVFSQAIFNSCNPAFIQISQKIGANTFEEYFDLFGYTEKISSDFLGEGSTIFFPSLGIVDLANASFGQGFKVTPIQHIRALCTIANGGYLVTPHLVNQIVDKDGNVVENIEYDVARQVVSSATCDVIMKALVNSTKNASVNGYNVVSKTGTSQKLDTVDDENDYVLSCVTFAPAEDPQIAILVLVDTPTITNSTIFGSSIAAPIVSNVLSEVLPYMGILPTESGADVMVTVKDYRGTDIDSAKFAIEEMGLKVHIKGNGTEVTDQLPRSGAELNTENGVVVLYTEGSNTSEMIVMPDLTNMSPTKVSETLSNRHLNISVDGIFNDNYTNSYVYSQSVPAGTLVAPGTIVHVEFRYNEEIE
ncbi:MAG: PASTA domain-containing protein [Clostridia bacterium]|nr:PASTA domain-containing protein [Clostridia bacterium]